ncbi:MAG: hypothetical protein WCB12_19065 [Bryobacteraceae bacterium]
MRISCALVLAALALAGCHRSDSSKEAVRQAVIDYVGGRGLNVSAMNVEVTAVHITGDHGEANVSFTAKSVPNAPGLSKIYLLEQRGARWVVTGSKQTGGMPHGGAMPGGMENPHGAMAPGAAANPHGAGAGGAVPALQDLPPVDKTKK